MFFKNVAPYVFVYIKNIMVKDLGAAVGTSSLSIEGARNYMADFALNSTVLSLSFLIVTSVVAVGIGFAQTRLNFAPQRLKPDFSRLSPFKNIKNMISLRTFIELSKSTVKVVIVSAILYTEIMARMSGFMGLFNKDTTEAIFWVSDVIYYIVMKIGAAMLGFGVLDYLYQWWDYERQLKMTLQEVKDEFKQTEGDPKLKGRQREIQRRTAMQRISTRVPLADVVVRNPTHFAVAIKYDPKKDIAPIVVAKGQDYLALRIVEIAEQNNITITENKPLARGLFAAVEIDQQIPPEFYQAVAEVLAFVYSLKKEKKRV